MIAGAVAVKIAIGAGTQVLLARLLTPEIFGQVAYAMVVAMFFNAFTNLRGDAYIVSQKESPKRAMDVVFTMEMAAAALFFLLVCLTAPYIMDSLGKGELTSFVQILALSFFYNPLVRPRSRFERDLSFVRSRLPGMVSEILAAASSIALALAGYGVWSLLWWRLSVPLIEVAILWLTVSERPGFRWDPGEAKAVFRYSLPLTSSAILVFFYYNVDYFIIGQVLDDSATQLGYYWLGFQAASYFLMARQIFYQGLLPIFSRLEDEGFKKEAFLRFSRAFSGTFLVLTLLALVFGRDAILFVYGKQWEPAVFPFQVISIVVLMRAINSNTGYYFHSSGKTMPDLVAALIWTILLPPLAYIGITRYGIDGAAVSVLIVQVIANVFIYERYVKPLTGKGALHFFFLPVAISGLALAAAVVSRNMEISLPIRLTWFCALFALAYVSVIGPVMKDIRKALERLHAGSPNARRTPIHQ